MAIPGCAGCTKRLDLATARPDGTGLEVITHTPGKAEGSPDWSPDGRRLVFDLYDNATDGTRIDTVGADGMGRRTVFAPGRIGAGDPVFSPDGTKIAFGYADGLDFWTMNPDGTELTDVTDTPSCKRWEWGPDSAAKAIPPSLLGKAAPVFSPAPARSKATKHATNTAAAIVTDR